MPLAIMPVVDRMMDMIGHEKSKSGNMWIITAIEDKVGAHIIEVIWVSRN